MVNCEERGSGEHEVTQEEGSCSKKGWDELEEKGRRV